MVTGLEAAGNHRFAGHKAETKRQGDVGRLQAQNQNDEKDHFHFLLPTFLYMKLMNENAVAKSLA